MSGVAQFLGNAERVAKRDESTETLLLLGVRAKGFDNSSCERLSRGRLQGLPQAQLGKALDVIGASGCIPGAAQQLLNGHFDLAAQAPPGEQVVEERDDDTQVAVGDRRVHRFADADLHCTKALPVVD